MVTKYKAEGVSVQHLEHGHCNMWAEGIREQNINSVLSLSAISLQHKKATFLVK